MICALPLGSAFVRFPASLPPQTGVICPRCRLVFAILSIGHQPRLCHRDKPLIQVIAGLARLGVQPPVGSPLRRGATAAVWADAVGRDPVTCGLTTPRALSRLIAWGWVFNGYGGGC
jgi:hypothetical protein